MTASPLWRRMGLFFLVPAIAAISPLLVLPIVARSAGQAGWASAIAGESVGTVAAILIGYGWAAIGPALVSIARDDRERGTLYRESLVIRLLIAVVALPPMGAVCWLVAAPGTEWLSVLMGLQGALIALSFTWFSAGVGEPRSIVLYDSVPRLSLAAISAVVIAYGAPVEVYPLAGVLVTLLGTGAFTLRALRRYEGAWPVRGDLRRLLRSGAPVALNDVALGAYSNVPTPLVAVTAAPAEAAGFASADKMLKLGQFIPVTLANALQAWIAEAHGRARSRRMRLSLGAHAAIGVIGWLGLSVAGAWVSTVLFGADASATTAILVAMGLTFAFFSVRTSMTRHILFPAGEAGSVVRATLIGTAVGVPAMVILTLPWGPLGAAIGYAATEGAATVLLWRTCRAAMRRLDATEPITT